MSPGGKEILGLRWHVKSSTPCEVKVYRVGQIK